MPKKCEGQLLLRLQLDSGTFQFPSVAAFVAGNAYSFSIALGDRSTSIAQGALDLFAFDSFKWRRNLTIEVGFRYEWNMAPTERFDRFYVFDPARVALVNVGRDIEQVYLTNAKNFQPRVAVILDELLKKVLQKYLIAWLTVKESMKWLRPVSEHRMRRYRK